MNDMILSSPNQNNKEEEQTRETPLKKDKTKIKIQKTELLPLENTDK